MRVCLLIGYDGSRFLGFAQQKHTSQTIMGQMLKALQKLGIKDVPAGSGRTDKGVHALHQVLHLDLPSFWKDLDKLKAMLNRHLEPSIHIHNIKPVKKNFHARFDASKREYRYVFCHGKFSPFLSSYAHFYPFFDLEKLDEILELFKGKHNFEYFKKNGSETKNFTREIKKIKALRYKDKTIIIIQADGFLRSQIRMMISAILKTYEGKLSLEQLKEQLDRKTMHSNTLSPPNGLYLSKVFYSLR